MSCILYKGTEKILVDATALENMIAQGWQTQPEFPETPTAAQYQDFLKEHIETKRINDKALSERDALIDQLRADKKKLDDDNKGLETENSNLNNRLQDKINECKQVRTELDALKENIGTKTADEEPKKDDQDTKSVKKQPSGGFSRMTVGQLRECAKRANIAGFQSMKRPNLIKALNNGSKTQNKR